MLISCYALVLSYSMLSKKIIKNHKSPLRGVVCTKPIRLGAGPAPKRRWPSLRSGHRALTEPLKGLSSSFAVILSIMISCFSCSWIYFFTVPSLKPTVLTYVNTVGANKEAIQRYIRFQQDEDMAADKMTAKEYANPFKK